MHELDLGTGRLLCRRRARRVVLIDRSGDLREGLAEVVVGGACARQVVIVSTLLPAVPLALPVP